MVSRRRMELLPRRGPSTLIHYKAVCIFPRLSRGTNLESYSDLFVIDDSGAGTGERGTDTWDLSPRS